MRKIIFSVLVSLLILTIIPHLRAESPTISDILLGTSEMNLYSYRLGTLQITKGETLYVQVIAQSSFTLEISLEYQGQILNSEIANTGWIVKLYTFESDNFGNYSIIVSAQNGVILGKANVSYLEDAFTPVTLNYFIKEQNNALYLLVNSTLNASEYSTTAKYYAAILYNGSYINDTNQLVLGILGGTEGSKIVRYGVSIIEQNITGNSISIIPKILNSTNGYISMIMDYLYAELYYLQAFTKYLNGTKVLTYVPVKIADYNYTDFIIGKDQITFQVQDKSPHFLILSINGYRSEGSTSIKYLTSFITYQGMIFQLLGLGEMKVNFSSTGIYLYGSINMALNKIFFTKPEQLRDKLLISTIMVDGAITRINYKKFDYKYMVIKIFNEAKNEYITNFNIETNDAMTYVNNDTAILFYEDKPQSLNLTLNGLTIPINKIYNGNLSDYSENIIKDKFYSLNVSIIAGDLAKPNATLKIIMGNDTIYDEQLTFGAANLILPEGSYLLVADKPGFNSTSEYVYLNEDKLVILKLYPINNAENNSNFSEIASILSTILIIHAIFNFFIYRRLKKL
ncbi:MAG TPA: hypothetical protein VKU94_04360 [Geobacterales bacterium]|nr:hypothetical protein [Geobacterales bacterium]